MIVADASALVAIALEETDAERFIHAIQTADAIVMPAPTALEVHLVLGKRLGESGQDIVAPFFRHGVIEIVDWTAAYLPLAQAAFRRFGGRPARLNFGDCMVYAVAKALGAPLLYKGDDFARTDIRSAL